MTNQAPQGRLREPQSGVAIQPAWRWTQ